MKIACEEAKIAENEGEVPVGAVLVFNGAVYRDHNRMIQTSDPTMHAEIAVIRRAAKAAGNYRLNGSTLYVSIEPCLMCAGAIVHARIARLVYAACDERYGAIDSRIKAFECGLNHRPAVTSGVLAQECSGLIKRFFAARRTGEVPKRL